MRYYAVLYGVGLGPLGGHFGVGLGSLWDHFGIALVGVTLGRVWGIPGDFSFMVVFMGFL